MELLRSDNQIDVWQTIDQFAPAALRHATHETEDDIGSIPPDFGGDAVHLVDCFLLCVVANAAGIQQDDVSRRFRSGHGISLGDELSTDSFAVTLVHLATVRLDVNTGHSC